MVGMLNWEKENNLVCARQRYEVWGVRFQRCWSEKFIDLRRAASLIE
jgi:hypothetical protein